jgi:hypothetical protein
MVKKIKPKTKQKLIKPSEEEIKKAAHEWAVFLYDVYQDHKQKLRDKVVTDRKKSNS